jgi:hypothetical protein
MLAAMLLLGLIAPASIIESRQTEAALGIGRLRELLMPQF